MNQFEQNILQAFDKRGKIWLEQIPFFVTELKEKWALSSCTAINNMTWNYVFTATSSFYGEVVGKICFDKKAYESELMTLKAFHGKGMIQLLSSDPMKQALLLKRAFPGTPLLELYPHHSNLVFEHYQKVIQKISSANLKVTKDLDSVENELEIILNTTSNAIPNNLLDQASKTIDHLQTTKKTRILLHGDLHLDNILLNQNQAVAIDPKGIVGEIEYEIAAFNFLSKEERNHPNSSMIFTERLERLCKLLDVDAKRVKQWVFIRLILASCWRVQDHLDPQEFLKVLHAVFSGSY